MRKKIQTSVYFDYGGYYTEDYEWVSRNSVYAILLKTSSLEQITYSMLVEKICKKISIDETTCKVKLSYKEALIPREIGIKDDDDVTIYLQTDEDRRRSVLHVEVLNDLDKNVVGEVSRAVGASSVGGNYMEPMANDKVDEEENCRIMTIFGDTNEEPMESVGGEISGNEIGEKTGTTESGEKTGTTETGENIGNENDGNEEFVNNGFDSRHEYVELPSSVEERQIEYIKEWEDGTGIEKGQEFTSKEALQDLVRRAASKNCFGVFTVKSDQSRIMLRCSQASGGCKWYVHAARVKCSSIYSVRVHRKMHTCSRCVASNSSSKLKGTPSTVASVLHEDYPGLLTTPTPKSIMSIVQGKLGLNVSYSTALRGKKQHVSDVRGTPERSYHILFSYLHMLQEVNPGTVTSVELDEERRFKYLFIALGASIEGFRDMRKVIVVDATFLKGMYGGMLVFATAQDPNRHHYPIAFGVIDSENDASWRWFFKMLKSVILEVPGLVFISDRNKSIINGVAEVFPNAHHAHCVYHLSQNVRGKVRYEKDDVAGKFMHLAHIYTTAQFNMEYEDYKRRFPTVHKYLDASIGMEKWTRCYFQGDKYNIDTSNSAESMNAVFEKARKYSLLPLIDSIVEKISEWFNLPRETIGTAPEIKKLVPVVENELHTRCAVASHLKVSELNSFQLEYSVIGLDGMTYLVDLRKKSCSCRTFDIDKYPCVHGIAANRFLMRKEDKSADIQLYQLCSRFYWIDTWALAYHRTIYLVPHESKWSVPGEVAELFALPPEYVKKAGRKQEKRFPSTGERRRRKKNKFVHGINLEKWLQPESPNEEEASPNDQEASPNEEEASI